MSGFWFKPDSGPGLSRALRLWPQLVLVFIFPANLLATEAPKIEINQAWTLKQSETGKDAPLYMTIINHADAADSLLRVRCPVSQLSEKRVVDHGEGAPSTRELKAIAIPAATSTVLAPDVLFINLLSTTEKLEQGGHFSCSLTFQNAGKIDVEVAIN